MKTYLTNEKVEKNLQEINYILRVLYFVVNGLKNLDFIDNEELACFEFILEEGNKRINALMIMIAKAAKDI